LTTVYERSTQANPERRLRFIVSGGLGDCLLSTPFLRHFKTVEPYRWIECWCPQSAMELFRGNPHVDRLLGGHGELLRIGAQPEAGWDVFSPYLELTTRDPPTVGLQKGRNLLNRPLLEQIAAENNLSLADPRMEVFPGPEEEAWARTVAAAWSQRQAVHFNPLSGLPEKNLPAPFAAEVVSRLVAHFEVVVFGAVPSLEPQPRLHQFPRPTLLQLAALYRHLAAVVTVDSFPAHLAAAIGVPAVVMFGPSNPACWGHPGQALLRPSDCPACSDTDRLRRCTRHRCLEAFSSESILSTCLQASANSREGPAP
jgi:ADP-heptose:LPS heptosyltransferase